MDKPKRPVGQVEIEGVGIFDANKVPKYAYLQQKIIMGMCIIALPVLVIWFWILVFFLFGK